MILLRPVSLASICSYKSPDQRTNLIITGGSAKAAADLVTQLKGEVVGYLFILEIPGLNGRDKLTGAPVSILLQDA